MAAIGGKDRVFPTDVEDLTVDVGGEVVFATVSTVRGIEDSPRGVRRFVGAQVHRQEGPLDFVRLDVNAFVGFEDGRRDLVGDRLTAVAKAPCQQHGEGHGQHERGSAHDYPSLGRDLKPSLLIQGAWLSQVRRS